VFDGVVDSVVSQSSSGTTWLQTGHWTANGSFSQMVSLGSTTYDTNGSGGGSGIAQVQFFAGPWPN
jgi:hypothetical protein